MNESPVTRNNRTNIVKPLKDHRSDKSYKILVLDDEEDICLLLSSILIKLGHRVVCSHSLKEGRSNFTSFVPDLMFLDINLPDGNGLSLAGAGSVRGAILVTGGEDEEQRRASLAMGWNRCLTKPVAGAEVIAAIKQILVSDP